MVKRTDKVFVARIHGKDIVVSIDRIYKTSIYHFRSNGEQSPGTAKRNNWSTGRKWQGKGQQHEANRKRIISSGTSGNKDKTRQQSSFPGSSLSWQRIELHSFFRIHYVCNYYIKNYCQIFLFLRYSKFNN